MRVVRFYQSCSPPPPPPPRSPPPPPLVSPRPYLHQLPPPLPPCQLFAKLFANSLRQALCQLPSSVCTGTSTWDLPSSVCTAGPQPGTVSAQCAPLDLNLGPGTCPAQCAPLDLNLGFAQRSVHRWTSTGDRPSSVRTAGPQRADRMPEDMPDRMSDGMPEDMPDKIP